TRPAAGSGQPDVIYVNLFAAGTADVDLSGGKVRITQATTYPWDGAVKMTLTPNRSRRFTVNVRIPGWAREEPVPSDLYRFETPSNEAATISVNGESVPMAIDKGYVAVDRTWKAGDTIALHLPMPVRRVISNDKVMADRDRVALQRGPVVYAA